MKGSIHLERGEAEAALDALNASLAHDREYPAALLNRAVAHYQSGRGQQTGCLDRARADFDRALGLPGADVAELERRTSQVR